MSEKEKAFALFDTGLRPHQIYDQVKVKKHTLYWYFQKYQKQEEARRLELEGIEREIERQWLAEEARERAEQEASERATRQQQELRPLTDKLYAVEAMIRHFQWFPKNLPMHWLTFGNAYTSPELYLEALKRQRDALRITIKEVSSRQVSPAFSQ